MNDLTKQQNHSTSCANFDLEILNFQNLSTSCTNFDLEILNFQNLICPFGLKHGVYTAAALKDFRIDEIGTDAIPVGGMGEVALVNVTKTEYQYKYNGFEYQDELDLNWYDYQARNYDPALGRWMNIDPLTEVSRKFSPYAYALDNPVFFIDPDGMMSVSSIQKMWDETETSSTWINNGNGEFEQVKDNPIFDSENGKFLGFDDRGMFGEMIVMDRGVYNSLSKDSNGRISHIDAVKNGIFISEIDATLENMYLYKNIVQETLNLLSTVPLLNPEGFDPSSVRIAPYSLNLGKGVPGVVGSEGSWGAWGNYNTYGVNFDRRGDFTMGNLYSNFEHEAKGHGGVWKIKYKNARDEHRQIYKQQILSPGFIFTEGKYRQHIIKWIKSFNEQ